MCVKTFDHLFERPDDAVGEGCLDCGVGGGGTDVVDADADDGVDDGGNGGGLDGGAETEDDGGAEFVPDGDGCVADADAGVELPGPGEGAPIGAPDTLQHVSTCTACPRRRLRT